MFKKGNILNLADNKNYVVVDKFDNDNKTYVYLVDMDDNTNIIYGRLENDEIVTISDADELEKVIQIVYNDLKNKE